MRDDAWLTGELGAIEIAGPDAESFLQGQLSLDVTAIAAGGAELAAWHNPQGRVRHLGWLGRFAADGWWLITESGSLATLSSALSRYVLRSRVKLGPPQDGVSVAFRPCPEEPQIAGTVRWSTPSGATGGPLRLVAGPAAALPQTTADDDALTGLLVSAGVPRLPASQSDRHVGQTLNLDLLGAISFSKGCFPGQEILARLHHRGKPKRRLLGWRSKGTQRPDPDHLLVDSEGKTQGQVVCAAAGLGGIELLAATRLQAAGGPLYLQGHEGALLTMPLPYGIPEME